MPDDRIIPAEISYREPQGVPTSGAIVQPQYGRMPVKYYPIPEGQMGQLSTLNDGVIKWKSLKTLAIGLALGFGWDIVPESGWADWSISPIRLLLVIAASIAAYLFHTEAERCIAERNSELDRIKNETVFEE